MLAVFIGKEFSFFHKLLEWLVITFKQNVIFLIFLLFYIALIIIYISYALCFPPSVIKVVEKEVV